MRAPTPGSTATAYAAETTTRDTVPRSRPEGKANSSCTIAANTTVAKTSPTSARTTTEALPRFPAYTARLAAISRGPIPLDGRRIQARTPAPMYTTKTAVYTMRTAVTGCCDPGRITASCIPASRMPRLATSATRNAPGAWDGFGWARMPGGLELMSLEPDTSTTQTTIAPQPAGSHGPTSMEAARTTQKT